MGILGLALNFILLFISSLIPCGKDQYNRFFCSSVKSDYVKKENDTYYFDNLLHYFAGIRDDLFPKNNRKIK